MEQETKVIITDISMPFMSMIKLAFASIPAIIIVTVVRGILGAIFSGQKSKK